MLSPTLKQVVQKLVRRTGYDIVRFSSDSLPSVRRFKLIKWCGINAVLDVGAGAGQYGMALRQAGYDKRILSFEPLKSAYGQLERVSYKDNSWSVFNLAVGEKEKETNFNIAGNSKSSSLLEMLPRHEMSAPDSRFVGQDFVKVTTLDAIVDEFCSSSDVVFLKMDTQGYERFILDGARKHLGRIIMIEMEMSLVPLYDGEWLFTQAHAFLETHGYRLVAVEPGFGDSATGELLQVNGTYLRP